jgi:hypothetical protein
MDHENHSIFTGPVCASTPPGQTVNANAIATPALHQQRLRLLIALLL